MGLQALIIEDDTMLSMMYTHALRTIKCEAIVITDGDVAWQTMTQYNPSVVILDMNLPGRSGNEIYTKLRQHIQYADVSILIITANDVMATALEPHIREIDFVLIKPLSITDLITLVSRLTTAA